MATQTYPDHGELDVELFDLGCCDDCGRRFGPSDDIHTYDEPVQLCDECARKDAPLPRPDAHDVYAGAWFFDPGAPSRDELYFDPETMQYADEPEHLWADMIINKAGDSGRVVNWASA